MVRVLLSLIVFLSLVMLAVPPVQAQNLWPVPKVCTPDDLKQMLGSIAPITDILAQVKAAPTQSGDDLAAVVLLLDEARLMFNDANIPYCADGVVLVGAFNRVIYSSELSMLFALSMEYKNASGDTASAEALIPAAEYQQGVMQSALAEFQALAGGYADQQAMDQWLPGCSDQDLSDQNWRFAQLQMTTFTDMIADIQDYLGGGPLQEGTIVMVERLLEDYETSLVDIPQCSDTAIEIIADESILYDTLLTLTMNDVLQDAIALGVDPAITSGLVDAVDGLNVYLNNSLCYWSGDPMCTPS